MLMSPCAGLQAIFVCDFGAGFQPTDDTQGVLDKICSERFLGAACCLLLAACCLLLAACWHALGDSAVQMMFLLVGLTITTFLKETEP